MSYWCYGCMDEGYGGVNDLHCRRCGELLVEAGTCEYCGGACDPDERFCYSCREDLEIAARRAVAFMACEDNYNKVSQDDRINILWSLAAVMDQMREELEKIRNANKRKAGKDQPADSDNQH